MSNWYERLRAAGRGGPGHGGPGVPPGWDPRHDPRVDLRGMFGWGPGAPPGGGPGPFGGGWPFFGLGGRRPRVRRGDVRIGILALLAEQPRNGYQIMQELEQRSHGMWRPSPGSVYPALQQLEDEGLVRAQKEGGGRVFELTESGRAHVDSLEADARAPWEAVADAAGDEMRDLMGVFRSTAVAAMQVMRAGTDKQRAQARKILLDARRALYRVLADGVPDEGEDP